MTGHTYMQVGFSTATVIRGSDGKSYGNLEKFRLVVDGRTITASDRNIWGVTFAEDDDTFYATAASGGKTWLVRGDLSARTLTSVHQNAECPSLSPDGSLVAYKKRVPVGGKHWSLAVLDLASGRETVLGETSSVDDQVEWLDDVHAALRPAARCRDRRQRRVGDRHHRRGHPAPGDRERLVPVGRPLTPAAPPDAPGQRPPPPDAPGRRPHAEPPPRRGSLVTTAVAAQPAGTKPRSTK